MPKGDYMDYDKGGYINPKYAAEGAAKKKYGGNTEIQDGKITKEPHPEKFGRDVYRQKSPEQSYGTY